MTSLGKFVWPLRGWPTSCDVLHCQALQRVLAPYFVCFIGKEAEIDGSHAELEQQKYDKPKDQGEKLVKLTLQPKKENHNLSL